jgi:O-antigen/teichoic acid export membrane protein
MGSDGLAGRLVRGSAYSVAASLITLTLGFVRSVILARLLLPQHFGVVALAMVFLNLAGQIRAFGMDKALIHRPDVDQGTLATYFTLRMATLAVSLIVVLAAIPLLTPFYPNMPALGAVMAALVGVEALKGLNSVQETLLNKDLEFRAIALTNVVASVTMTVVAPWMAWSGFGVWALVGERASGMIARWVMVWLVFRRWTPRFGWDGAVARWFWRYGRAVWGATSLAFLLDRFDDFWTGTFLGKTPLGYYSRAYEFARYPRRVIANPLVSVFMPTFAKLQGDRTRLSKAFFRMMSLMVRVGCLFALLLILTAPEFIRLLLGEKWIPMTLTFQLMVVYVSIDPMMAGMHQLLLAVGKPMVITKVRVWQMLFFVPAVVGLGTWKGIVGVAVAADLMVLLGAMLLSRRIRRVVDFSWRILLTWPLVGVAAGATVALATSVVWKGWPLVSVFFAKIAIASVVYSTVLLITEREQIRSGWLALRHALKPGGESGR